MRTTRSTQLRSPRARALGTALFAALACGGATGCESPIQGPQNNPAPPPPAARPNTPAAPARPNAPGAPAAGGANAAAATSTDGPPPLVLNDSDFTESDRARDPFRSFAREFVPTGPIETPIETRITLREYTLDQLRLVAVIVGTDNPYAMVIDPTGRGTIIRRGEYVGRPENVQSGRDGSLPHQVPWRVSRIVATRVTRDRNNNLLENPGAVFFEREDRLNPNAERVEREMSLDPRAALAANRAEGPEPEALPTLPGTTGSGTGPTGTPPFLPPPLSGSSGAPPTTGSTLPGQPQIPPGSVVQQYTTIVPGQPAQQAPPTTVVIQTSPDGTTRVAPPGSAAQRPPAQPAPQGPRDPYLPPPGGSSAPPPVTINSQSGLQGGSMPSSGLSGQ